MCSLSNASESGEKPFYADGLRFSCNNCSACCRFEPGLVRLSEKDLCRLAEWAGVTEEQFTLMYCRWVETGDGEKTLCLREKSDYDCIFWKDGCTAYEARPVQCRTYPFWTGLLKSRDSWEREKKRCPGLDAGDFHSGKEIEGQLSLYEQRKPIVYPLR